jgi:hypothetical protein|tara:strand:+ start:2553 stop:2954 length:402 start_codon:yes stop_codon:yes gene_type:complete
MIRNYENPENTISLIDSSSVSVPVKVFTSSTTGGPIAGGVIGRTNAITTIAFCNTAAATTADETTNAVTVNVYLVRSGKSYVAGNLIVSSLVVPAGETVFFSEERVVLESGDEIWVGTSDTGRLSVLVSALAV